MGHDVAGVEFDLELVPRLARFYAAPDPSNGNRVANRVPCPPAPGGTTWYSTVLARLAEGRAGHGAVLPRPREVSAQQIPLRRVNSELRLTFGYRANLLKPKAQ
jgi:hypothetical protein